MNWWQWLILGLIIFNALVVAVLMWRSPGNDVDAQDEHDKHRGI